MLQLEFAFRFFASKRRTQGGGAPSRPPARRIVPTTGVTTSGPTVVKARPPHLHVVRKAS